MKTPIEKWEEIEDAVIYVMGDWRTISDNPTYDAKKGRSLIVFSGAVGYYYFGLGRWDDAIKAWRRELGVISDVEQTEGKRMHKGWFYYYLARAYHALGNKKMYGKYLALANEEDKLSYGEKAATFPANQAVAS